MKRCIYSVILPEAGTCCNVYSQSKRLDGKLWAHWPKCSKENCPFENPALLEGAVFDKTNVNFIGSDIRLDDTGFIYCKSCLFFEDCENKEGLYGCYFGEPSMEDL